MSARAHLEQLFAKADAFFDRVRGRHPSDLACAEGCHDCCAPGLTVTAVEADAIRDLLATSPPLGPALGRADRCAALGADGRCRIYRARPVVCRTHGVPIRFPADRARRALPVVQACAKNFVGVDLDRLEPTSVLDQTTLSTLLFAVDAAFATERETPQGARFAIAELVRDLP